MKPRVIFAGTPEFALPSLRRLLEQDFQVVSVLTQPDRHQGRGRKLTAPPVKQLASAKNIPVLQTERISKETIAQLKEYEPDVMIVVAFGLILPRELLKLPRLGCINVHASLLPRWRGAAPIARAIESGDSKTGITIMQMDSGLDTGAMLSQSEINIEPGDTTSILQEKLAEIGALELIKVLGSLPKYQQNAIQQVERLSTYAAKLSVAESLIDWQLPAFEIVRKIHACNPWPIARTQFGDMTLRIWSAEVCSPDAVANQAGGVIESNARCGIVVGAGQNAVRILNLQREGKKRMRAADFLSGCPVPPGSIFS